MRVAGIDEVGRGPLAGPVVAAAVVLPAKFSDPRIKDSKQLSPQQREQLVEVITNAAEDWAIVAVGHHRIRALNIRNASKLAMSLALRRVEADAALIDGNMAIDTELPQQTVIGGDAIHPAISAASIIAKVFRDRLMAVLDRRYPGYGFSAHAGYPTEQHRTAVRELGPCPVHRVTFRGVREYLCVRGAGRGSVTREFSDVDVEVVQAGTAHGAERRTAVVEKDLDPSAPIAAHNFAR